MMALRDRDHKCAVIYGPSTANADRTSKQPMSGEDELLEEKCSGGSSIVGVSSSLAS